MNIAVVGTNFISDRFVDAARAVDGVSVAAVYSRTEESGGDFARRHGIAKLYTDYAALLSDSEIDALYIASPTLCHAEQSILAMIAGKHVLCEKMMAAELADFLRMKDIAKSTGRVLLEAMRPAHDPAYGIVTAALPKIGKIRRATFDFCQYSSRYDRFKSGVLTNAFDPKMKNSALSDIGIYPLFAAVRFFGIPEGVKSSSILLANGFEAEGTLLLSYEDAIVSVVYSKISESVTPSVIEGEFGSITIDKISSPTEIILHRRGGEREVLYTAEPFNNMIYEIEAFRDMCAGALKCEEYLATTEIQQRIVDEVYRAEHISDYFS